MKKRIIYFITILTLFNCLSANAQEDKIYGGIKVAPNYSVITDKADKWKSGIGFSIGYFEGAELTNKINLQAEINYSVYSFNNAVIDGYDNNGNEKTSRKNKTYKSIEIPIMAKYRVSDQFAIGLGYQVSLRTKVKDETGSNDFFGSSNNDNEGFSFTSLFSPKHSTSGIFVDASYKGEKVICGLRILQTNKALIDETHRSINASFYVGFPLF